MRLITLQTQNNSAESSAENNVENDNETIANIIYFFNPARNHASR